MTQILELKNSHFASVVDLPVVHVCQQDGRWWEVFQLDPGLLQKADQPTRLFFIQQAEMTQSVGYSIGHVVWVH